MHLTCYHIVYTLDWVTFTSIIKGKALTSSSPHHPAALVHSLEIHTNTRNVTTALLVSSCRSYRLREWRSPRCSLYCCLSSGRCKWPLARHSAVSFAREAADAAASVCHRSCAQEAGRSAEACRRVPAVLGAATSRSSAVRRMAFEASWYHHGSAVEAIVLVVSATVPQRSLSAAATRSLAKCIVITFVFMIGCCCSCNLPLMGCPPFSVR